ncbi:MAG: hypothetical protein K1X75_13420 [Leptospirales bacterium]|nr:hypothetical protein [Leptospirales bacterium]
MNMQRWGGILLLCIAIGGNLIFRSVQNMIWICHLSALLCGLGLLVRHNLAAQVGGLWLTIGLGGWLADAISHPQAYDSVSWIMHFSYLTGAAIALLRLPVRRSMWLGAIGWYLFAQALARLFGDASENVNFAFAIWPSWRSSFERYLSFWLFFLAAAAAIALASNLLLLALQSLGFPSWREKVR